MRRFIYLVMAISAIIGFGHSQASAQVINGCISKNGTLKIVVDSSDCSSRETPISWNQQGPQGDAGDTGEPGAPGVQGPPGSFRVVDATGQDIGVYAGRDLNSSWFFVYSEELQITFEVDPKFGIIRPSGSLSFYFAEPNCLGPAYSLLTGMLLHPNLGDPGTHFFVTSNNLTDVTVKSIGTAPFSEFCQGELEESMIPVASVQSVNPADLGLNFPLPAPLTMLPAPE